MTENPQPPDDDHDSMESLLRSPRRRLALAFFVEAAIGVAALLLGLLVGVWPLRSIADLRDFQQIAIDTLWGLAGTIPMLLLLVWLMRTRWQPMERLRELVVDEIVSLFRGMPFHYLLLIAIAAGVGEELLFRGLIYDGLRQLQFPGSSWVALIGSAVVFGLAHHLTRTYAVVATVIGAYLALLFQFAGTLWVPIVAHAGYDFIALMYMVRQSPD